MGWEFNLGSFALVVEMCGGFTIAMMFGRVAIVTNSRIGRTSRQTKGIGQALVRS
jgi:hypothetical protein